MRERINRRELLTLGGSALMAATGVRSAARDHDRPVVPKFERPLSIPDVLAPVRSDRTTDYYEITQREAQVEILPGLLTTIWGYNGMFPGPTIEARCGRTTVVHQTNRLRGHTAVHLHGGVTPADSDGFPTDMIVPGNVRTYTYPNEGRAATLWYHDHVMDATGKNVCMGLAGLYLLRDDRERALNLPKGPYDIPLMIQDRRFDARGAFVYDTFHQLAAKGGTMLVNGTPWPRLEVATRKYRFRIVNASNATPLRLALSSGKLSREIMRFDVVRTEADDSALPGRLSDDLPANPAAAVVRSRSFVFAGRPGFGLPLRAKWQINGQDFHADRAIAAPRHGDIEIWHLRNRRFLGLPGFVHPVHVHLVNFQVVERNGGAPLPHELGWKDTVSVGTGEDVKIAVRFEGYRGRYVMHCHNLEHEDHNMMARFDVV